MDQPGPLEPLHEIETQWSEVIRAQRDAEDGHLARERMALRYIGAVRHYIARKLRDPGVADELAQEFAVRMMRGAFRSADPSRGRFRDYVKAAATNLVRDHHREVGARASTAPLVVDLADPSTPTPEDNEPDAEFLRSWRRGLLHGAMAALAAYQERTGRKYYDIITLRTTYPELNSAELAAQLGPPATAVSVRQALRRARVCLADLLLEEVAASLERPSFEAIEQELIHLDLLDYCRESLKRRGPPSPRR